MVLLRGDVTLTMCLALQKTEWEKNSRQSVLDKVFNGAFTDFINNLMLQQPVSQVSSTHFAELRYNLRLLAPCHVLRNYYRFHHLIKELRYVTAT